MSLARFLPKRVFCILIRPIYFQTNSSNDYISVNNQTTDKPQADASLIWRLTKNNRKAYLFAAVFLFLATVFNFLIPLIASATIDYVLQSETDGGSPLLLTIINLMGGPELLSENLWIPLLASLICASIAGVFNYFQKRGAAREANQICRKLKDRIYDHIQQLSTRYLDETSTGDLVQRCTSDIETIRLFLAAHVVEIGKSIILVITVIPIMLMLNAWLTLASTFLIPIIVLFGYFYFKKVKHVFKGVDEAEGKLTTVVQENITGIRVVRAFGRHKYEIDRFAEPNKEYRDKGINLIKLMSWFWALSDFLNLAQIGIALIAGSYMALNGYTTIGTLFAFLALLNIVLWPIRMLGRILTDLGKTIVALGRLYEVLNQPTETKEDKVTESLKSSLTGRIDVKNVNFAYNENTPTLKAINFSVNPGETLAIIGPSGTGKSTLMHLLMRFYDVDSGEIRVDGFNIKDLDRRSLRAQFGVVLQEPFLYSRSIKENIRFGHHNSDDSEIKEVAQMASIHETIDGFTHGYETEIGERGITLSGGQRQRVALSRALLSAPPILLLDDALSAVDNETEANIIEALKSRHGKSTTIVIAHRLSTLAHADKILVLEKGQISQYGTHQDLIREEGLYRRLWEIQNEVEKAS